MGRTRNLLEKQEIQFDNHHPATSIEWDDDLHFHKKMTVDGPKGKRVNVSGVFHVKKNRGIGVTYDKGKSHPKIKDNNERDNYERQIRKEIGGIIEKDNIEADVFVNRVMSALDSLSSGENKTEITRRKQQAFDSIMDALGISTERKITIKNRNKELFAFYVDRPNNTSAMDSLFTLLYQYNSHLDYVGDPNLKVYYISDKKSSISMGELTPFTVYKYKWRGFKFSKESIQESMLKSGED